MSFADFAEPEVFVDTNIFVYALAKTHRYKSTCETLQSKMDVDRVSIMNQFSFYKPSIVHRALAISSI